MSTTDGIVIHETPTDTERAHARHLIAALADAERALQSYIAPAMGTRFADDPNDYEEDETVPLSLVCPWCGRDMGDDGVIAVDAATRWTYSEIDDEDQSIRFHYDGNGDYEGLMYMSACCELPVSEPDGWEMDA